MPINRTGVALTFYAYYEDSTNKDGEAGLADVTVDVYEGTTAAPIVTAAAASELAGGLYYYTLASGSVDAQGAYVAMFKTAAATVTSKWLPALWQVWTAGAPVNAIALGGTTQTGNDVGADVNDILDDTDDIGVAGAGLTALGDTRIGNLDATVSSRSTYAGGAVASVSGSVGSVAGNVTGSVGSVAGNVVGSVGSVTGLTASNLDVAVSTRAVAGDAMALTSGERTSVGTAVWASTTRTLTSFGTLVADAAAAVWAYATRVLTQSAASVASTVAGTTITAVRGDTLTASLTGLGNISTRSKLWISVKRDPGTQADTAATIFVEETAGLTVVNGAAYTTTTDSTITVTDATTGALTWVVKPAVTDDLVGGSYVYDIQMLTAAGAVTTLTKAAFRVDSETDVTRAIA